MPLALSFNNYKFRRSERLDCLYDQLLPGGEVWDVCCDHGYLGLRALQAGLFSVVHFVDQAPHLIQRLREQVDPQAPARFYPLPLQSIQESLTGTLVIAGVGGVNLLEMLQVQFANSSFRPQRLVLGPHRDEELVKQYLESQGLGPVSSFEVQEGTRRRSVYVLDLNNDS